MAGWIALSADRLLGVGPRPRGARGREARPIRGWLILGPRPHSPNAIRPTVAHGEITSAGPLVHNGAVTVDELAMLELIGLDGDDAAIAAEFGLQVSR